MSHDLQAGNQVRERSDETSAVSNAPPGGISSAANGRTNAPGQAA